MTTYKSGWNIPKRYLALDLAYANKPSSQFAHIGVDFKVQFSITEAVSGALTEANIVISGLTPGNMFDVATSTTQWIANWQPSKVKLIAGYETNHGVIFEGAVIHSDPNLDKSEYTITMKCMDGFDELSDPKSYSFAGTVPVVQIVRKVASDAGLVVVDGTDGKTTIANFAVQDKNHMTIFRMLSQATGLEIFINSGRVYIKNPGEALPRLPELTITSADIIGTPHPTDTGVIIDVPLNPALRTGQAVQVKSKKFPKLDSIKFYLSTLSHVGDTYGKDWYTRLTLIKQGLGYYAKSN